MKIVLLLALFGLLGVSLFVLKVHSYQTEIHRLTQLVEEPPRDPRFVLMELPIEERGSKLEQISVYKDTVTGKCTMGVHLAKYNRFQWIPVDCPTM
jgi:hypothetical protein